MPLSDLKVIPNSSTSTGPLLERQIGLNVAPSFMFRAVQTAALADLDGPGGLDKLVAIVAPVGYGKTVLMSSLFARLQARGQHCFWISLDERDTSIERVLARCEATAYRRSEQLHPTQALFRGGAPLETRIDGLVSAASNYPAPCFIFFDNLNSCTDEALARLLDRLVFETPPSVHLVFSSTSELPLNLARAKIEGLVRQVDYVELSLSNAETADLLGRELSAAIGTAGVEAVRRQTEGWPAAVRMMQIILSGADRPQTALKAFSGSDEDLAAFLNRQVLSGFSPELREFLLDIAPLSSFCVDLCNHATGCLQAEEHLSLLLRRNVFLIPLDRNRTWYRLHGLFREYLLGQAQNALSPARRQQVLERAAEWYRKGAYWREAIDYSIAAGDYKRAASLLDCTATIFVRDAGDIPQYIAWVEAVRQHQRGLGWDVEYWYVWALLLHRRYDSSRQQLQRLLRRIERANGAGQEAGRLGNLKRRLDITLVCVDIFGDQLADAQRNAARWLEGNGMDDPFNVTAARCTQSAYFASAFLFAEAREAVQAAQLAAYQIQSGYTRGWIIALNALPSILEGNYAQIHPELTSALGSLNSTLGEGAGICGTVALLGATCAVEMGLDDEARALLAQGMRSWQEHGLVDTVACGLNAAVKLWPGDVDDPLYVPRLRDVAASYPARAGVMLSCALVRRLLRLGRVDEAQAEAARIGLFTHAPSVIPKAIAAVARSRDAYLAAAIELCIASGEVKLAEPLIVEETRRARAEGRSARLVELALAETAIAVKDGNQAAGNRHLTRAVTLAATRGIVRPFDDYANEIALLVEDTRPSAWGFALAQERRAFSEICRRLPISNPGLQETLNALDMDPYLLDRLTKRQVELLGLLDAGLSNQQIADRLNLTLTTVKGHLQKLYAKFDVSSRSAALARARAMKLL